MVVWLVLNTDNKVAGWLLNYIIISMNTGARYVCSFHGWLDFGSDAEGPSTLKTDCSYIGTLLFIYLVMQKNEHGTVFLQIFTATKSGDLRSGVLSCPMKVVLEPCFFFFV